jgi:AcrR family transcriptional regulator
MTGLSSNKDKILEASIDLFAAKGFRGTSIRDISNAVGISISNIYHYFGNKEGVLLAILQRSGQDIFSKLHQVSNLDIKPLERFKKLVSTHVKLAIARESVRQGKIFFLDEEHLSTEGNEINLQLQRQIFDIYRRELRTLESLGQIRPKNLTVMVFNVLGVINWCLRWYRPDGPMSLDDVSEEVVSFVLHGVLGSRTLNVKPIQS